MHACTIFPHSTLCTWLYLELFVDLLPMFDGSELKNQLTYKLDIFFLYRKRVALFWGYKIVWLSLRNWAEIEFYAYVMFTASLLFFVLRQHDRYIKFANLYRRFSRKFITFKNNKHLENILSFLERLYLDCCDTFSPRFCPIKFSRQVDYLLTEFKM